MFRHISHHIHVLPSNSLLQSQYALILLYEHPMQTALRNFHLLWRLTYLHGHLKYALEIPYGPYGWPLLIEEARAVTKHSCL